MNDKWPGKKHKIQVTKLFFSNDAIKFFKTIFTPGIFFSDRSEILLIA